MKRTVFTRVALGYMAVLCLACAPRTTSLRINVESERIYLGDLVNKSELPLLEGWPPHLPEQAALVTLFSTLREKALVELRRCEKLGHYQIVDLPDQATLTLTLSSLPPSLSGDSLIIDIASEVRDSQGTTVRAYKVRHGVPNAIHRLKSGNLGEVLARYTATFPYRDLVSPFY